MPRSRVSRRRAGFAPALAALLASGGLAQVSAQDPQAPAPVFESEVNYVEVDAFVMDAEGRFLRGLSRDDFEILEEGVPQQIASFTEISIPIENPDVTFAEDPPRPRDTATNERALEGRIYVFVLDETHVDPRRSGFAREIATQFIDEQMAPDDIAAVVFTGDKADAGHRFTTDKRLLKEAVTRFQGRKPPSSTLQRMSLIEFQRDTAASQAREPEEAFAPVRGRDIDPSDLERAYNARKSMETLENVARELGALRGRRKSILYFSEGIDYDTLDVMRVTQRDASKVVTSIRDAVAAASRNSVAVYPVDPRGLISGLAPDDIQMGAVINPTAGPEDQTAAETPPALTTSTTGIDSQSLQREVLRSLDSLQTLAADTGGSAVVDTNDFGSAYESIVRANSHYYLLGYYPSDFRRDGRFRSIEVRVRRPDVTVVARDGYVRPSGDRDEEGRPGALAETATSPEVRELLERPWAQPGLTVGVTAAAFRAAEGAASVAVTVQLAGEDLPFRQDGDRFANEIELSVLAIDPEGRIRGGDRMLAQPRLRSETLDRVRRLGLRFVKKLELPPGRYQLRVAAREAEQGKRGSVFYDLQVPDYRDEPLAMSGVLVTSESAARTLTAATEDEVQSRLATPPTVTRVFGSDDVVTAYTEVYGDPEPAHDVTITARVTNADGNLAFRATTERSSSELAADGGLPYEVAIPLERLDPGRYVLDIEASRSFGEQTAKRSLSFDVVRATGGRSAGDDVAPWNRPRPTADLPHPGTRLDRLEAWLEAVEEHEPGTADRAARMVRSWAPWELAELAGDLALVARLIEHPNHPVLWIIDPTHPTRFQRAPYSTGDEERLRAAAREAALRCGPVPDSDDGAGPDEETVRCARNRLLKRGAVLHTDAAIRVEASIRPEDAGGPEPARWLIRFSDGQQRAAQGAPGHWELARSLLDNVAPAPDEDETVRLWYIATSAFGQFYERHTRHEERATDLFPDDPQLLFLAACLHETFGSPRIQSLAHSIRVSGGRHGIDSEESELKQAEKLFRRALEADPALVEARIRLGRVLYLLGRPEQASRELRQAVATLLADHATDPDAGLLLYFAEMFFGSAAEDLGQRERARASYARAAELYPGAPSPNLALSQLALAGDDGVAARDAVQHALLIPVGDRDDPLWRYHSVQGRDAEVWFDRLHRSLVSEP